MLVFFLSCLHVNAQSPFGHYICRYILTKDNSRVNYHRIYRDARKSVKNNLTI